MSKAGALQPSLQSQLLGLKSRYSDTLSRDEALGLALEAAELHLKFMKLATSKEDKNELSKKCKSLLDEAERIKTSDTWKPEDNLLVDFTSSGSDSSTSWTKKDPATSKQNTAVLNNSALSTVSGSNSKFKALSVPVSDRILSKAEEIILLKASKLHGCVFPAFKGSLQLDQLDHGQGLLVYKYVFSTGYSVDRSVSTHSDSDRDSSEMKLSANQLQILDAWKRPGEALPPPSWPDPPSFGFDQRPSQHLMKASRNVDLVQDAASDCSVVASLSAGIARVERGFADILSTAIHPFDVVHGIPSISSNGKYTVCLNFNGCLRQVVIDDRLPVSNSSRVLHVVDRNNPNLLWPALLEKAYLKVRGGYDFPGSNSGTDLWVLTGWIPEQVFLQHEETNSEKLWTRMLTAFGYGDVLITLGTGAMTPKSEKALGLAGEHDYAVISIDDSFGQRRLLIKNPWLKATAWKGYHVRSTSMDLIPGQSKADKEDFLTLHSSSAVPARYTASHVSQINTATELSPGTFWMDMSDVMQNFDSVYLNWNPGLFKHRQDIHFTWDLTEGPTNARGCPGSFQNNPQFTTKSSQPDSMWFLLSKHFHGNSDTGNSKETQGFISLYAFLNHSNRVILSKGAIEQGPYVDSPQTLLALDVKPNDPFTIVVSEQNLPSIMHSFTLSAFSHYPVTLSLAAPRFSRQTSAQGSWTLRSAGGNASSAHYSINPQFSLTLAEPSALCLTLETLSPGLSVHVKLLYGQGHRVYSVTNRDIVVDSGDYRRGFAIAETKVTVPAGAYTIVCSTFESGQLGDFTLQVAGDVKASLAPIAREGAGRVRQRLSDASFSAGVRVVAAPFYPRRLAVAHFTAKYLSVLTSIATVAQNQAANVATHSPIRLTVEIGRGSERTILIASSNGMYSDSASGIRTGDIDLRPDMSQKTEAWLMLERLGGFDGVGKPEERVAVDMWADSGEAVDFGVWREWDR